MSSEDGMVVQDGDVGIADANPVVVLLQEIKDLKIKCADLTLSNAKLQSEIRQLRVKNGSANEQVQSDTPCKIRRVSKSADVSNIASTSNVNANVHQTVNVSNIFNTSSDKKRMYELAPNELAPTHQNELWPTNLLLNLPPTKMKLDPPKINEL